jgi:hypothetical protein
MISTMEDKRKHLEFIQNVITRMNSNSFLIKGWAITLISALFVLSAKDTRLICVLITYISIPIFWGLDALYLSMERKFRNLYAKVCLTEVDKIDYSMDISSYGKKGNSWLLALFSKTIWPVYSTMILITLLIMFLLEKVKFI